MKILLTIFFIICIIISVVYASQNDATYTSFWIGLAIINRLNMGEQ